MSTDLAARRPESPFDSLKHTDPDTGEDYWLTREMWEPAGYATWQKFEELVKRAIKVCEDKFPGQGYINDSVKSSPMPNGGAREVKDYRCTRYGAYMVLSRSDKPHLADYFVMQTMYAENAQRIEAVVSASPDKGSLEWFDALMSRGVVDFFANGNPKCVDPEYRPVQSVTVTQVPDKEAYAVVERKIVDAQVKACSAIAAERERGMSAVQHFYSALGRKPVSGGSET
jgi:hypothetical protein